MRNESSSVNVEDLPSENVPVSIDKLLSKILIQEPDVVYGLVVSKIPCVRITKNALNYLDDFFLEFPTSGRI